MPKSSKRTNHDFAHRMLSAREDAGLALQEVGHRLRVLLPDGAVSSETVRRWEKGIQAEDVADPIVLLALGVIYGVDVDELSPLHARTVDRIADLINREPDVLELVEAT